MGTQKWHLLGHIMQRLKEVVGIEYHQVGMYESHRNLKNCYQMSSGRTPMALENFIKKFEAMIIQEEAFENIKRTNVTLQPIRRTRSLALDRAVISNSKWTTAIPKLGNILETAAVSIRVRKEREERTNIEAYYYQCFQKNGVGTFCSFLRKKLSEKKFYYCSAATCHKN